MPTATAAQLAPGSRWAARGGPHKGAEVEYLRSTDGNRVIVRPVGKSGANWNRAKSEAAGVWTLGRETFERNYAPKGSLMVVGGSSASPGKAYRKPKMGPRQVQMDALVDFNPSPSNGVAKGPHLAASINDSHLQVELITITPDLARAWRDRDARNRKLIERRVVALVLAIQRGEWQLTGDSIKLDADGGVRDGQHRLEAIARAGIPVQTLVVRNLSETAFNVVDTGRPRQAADVLSIHGYSNSVATASVARGLLMIERYGRYEVDRHDPEATPTNTQILEYTQAHHTEIVAAVHMSEKIRQAQLVGGLGLWAIVLVMFARKDLAACEQYVDRLVTGAELRREDPILKLRNMFMNDPNWTSGRGQREKLLALAIKAWNAWRRGESVRMLSWRADGPKPEAFPTAEA